jgi:dUTP pyrophosphatase
MSEIFAYIAGGASGLPNKSHPDDAGFDLACLLDPQELETGRTLESGKQTVLNTGVTLAVPPGYMGKIEGRSGLAMKGISVLGGVIDSGYRGEIKVILRNNGDEPFVIQNQQRIAQFLVLKIHEADVLTLAKNVDELSRTKRGADGFGSTGKMQRTDATTATAAKEKISPDAPLAEFDRTSEFKIRGVSVCLLMETTPVLLQKLLQKHMVGFTEEERRSVLYVVEEFYDSLSQMARDKWPDNPRPFWLGRFQSDD